MGLGLKIASWSRVRQGAGKATAGRIAQIPSFLREPDTGRTFLVVPH